MHWLMGIIRPPDHSAVKIFSLVINDGGYRSHLNVSSNFRVSDF